MAASRRVFLETFPSRSGVGGGVESISLVQNEHRNTFRTEDEWLARETDGIYLPMLHTAEIVAERYGVTREAQDTYAVSSQQRTEVLLERDEGTRPDEMGIGPVPAVRKLLAQHGLAISDIDLWERGVRLTGTPVPAAEARAGPQTRYCLPRRSSR